MLAIPVEAADVRNSGPIQSLNHALKEATAQIHTSASQSALLQWLRTQRKEGVRLDNFFGVLKVPHNPDARFERELRILQKLQHPIHRGEIQMTA